MANYRARHALPLLEGEVVTVDAVVSEVRRPDQPVLVSILCKTLDRGAIFQVVAADPSVVRRVV